MKSKTIKELAFLLVSDDFQKQWNALVELEHRNRDVSLIPFLKQALFSEELAILDNSFRQQADETTDSRSLTALAYGSYEIDIFRYRIIQMLTKIGTKTALETVTKWQEYEKNEDG